MERLVVVYNPVAGRGRARQMWPEVEKALQAVVPDLEVVSTKGRGHAEEAAFQAALEGKALVSVGGDGTAHEVANGILRASQGKPGVPMGIIPLGNGDDFVKMLPPVTPVGSQPFDWRQAVAHIAAGNAQYFDACRATDVASGQSRYFINGLNLGFSAHAGYNFSTLPSYFTGLGGYLAAVLKTLWKYPLLRLSVSLDGQPPFSALTSMAAFMNGRCFGRAFWVCPHADAQDGRLEIMVVKKVGRLKILQKLPLILKAAHLRDPLLDWYQAQNVHVVSPDALIVEMDGEIPFRSVRELEISVLPGVLRVFC